MPRVSFAALPDAARIWIFASDRPLDANESALLLRDVDAFLDDWKAHGTPLRNAREWVNDQFLVIGVDPSAEQASGCSIDGLFRSLQQLGDRLGTSLVSGGRIFYQDASGATRRALRAEVRSAVQTGALTADSPVFDTSLTTAGDFRRRFEQPARGTWVGSLIG